MANSLLSIFGGGNSGLFMKAVGAMMRGESPQEFIRNLANTTPELRGVDLNDINGSAQRICREHGVDAGKLTEEIKQSIASIK